MTDQEPPPLMKLYEMPAPTSSQGPTAAKAVIAAVGSLTVAIATALADGRVTNWELVLGVLGAIGAGAAVWATTNEPAKKS